MSTISDDAVPEVSAADFGAYYRRHGPLRGSDSPALQHRFTALLQVRDPRLWRTDSGAPTDAVIASAATVACTVSIGFDVDDLVARAATIPRPELERIAEPGYTEPMLLCRKCGAWWGESKEAGHRPGC